MRRAVQNMQATSQGGTEHAAPTSSNAAPWNVRPRRPAGPARHPAPAELPNHATMHRNIPAPYRLRR